MQITDVDEYGDDGDYDSGDDNDDDDDYGHGILKNNDNVAKWTVFHLPLFIRT